LGIWVVLPDPVSPAITTTLWSRMTSAMSALRWLTGSSAGYEIGGMAARRAARAATRAAARSECDLDRPGRPDRSRAGPAGEDVTELDSIPAGRINQEGPYRITVFRPAAFLRLRACRGLCPLPRTCSRLWFPAASCVPWVTPASLNRPQIRLIDCFIVVDSGFVVVLVHHGAPDQPPSPFPPQSFRGEAHQ